MTRLIVAVSCLLFASPAFAQKVGDTVVVIAEEHAELRRSEVVGTALRGAHLRVDEMNGEWLWVNLRGTKGWINRRDVIHIDKAIDFFTAAIKRNPTAGDYSSRGRLWRAKREYDIAISDYNEAIRLDPRKGSVYNNRANVWSKKGEYDKAISDYDEAIRLDPKLRWVYNSRGLSWYDKGDYGKAISDFDQAIRLHPKYADSYYRRGMAWLREGQYEKAISDYNEAIRLYPKYAGAHYNRGRAWYYEGQYDKAISDYDKAFRLFPKYANVYYIDRGIAWAAKGEYDKAISDYDEAIRFNPKDVNAYNGIAWLRATCPVARYRDGTQAVENARKACELTDWKDHRCLDSLAAAYAENGGFGEAIKWQQKAIELAPAKIEADCRSRLTLYESRKPYREKPK